MILAFQSDIISGRRSVDKAADIDAFSKYNQILSNLRYHRFLNVALFYIVV